MAELAELLSKLKAADAAVTHGKTVLLNAVGTQIAQTVKSATPVDSGRLKESIHHEVRGNDTVVVTTDVEYAPYVDQGHTTKGGSFIPGRHMFEKALLTADPIVEAGIKVFLGKINILG